MSLEMSTKCPHCGTVNDRVSGLSGARIPKTGDITMCIACGQWAIYELDFIGLRLRKPTEEEWMDMETDETVQKVTWAWHAALGGE